MKEITLSSGKTVSKQSYITAKTKDLKAFGYNVTEETVLEQLDKILKDEKLSVIGMFMEDDIKKRV